MSADPRFRLLRALLAAAPISVGIDGWAREKVLWLGDRLRGGSAAGEMTVELDGQRLVLDAGHPNQRLLAYALPSMLHTCRRSPLGRLIAGRVRARDTFVDIGANLGLYSLLARRQGGDAVLFEPEPAHGRFLERNAALFGRVFGVALSDSEGSADFYVGRDSKAGVSSLVGPGGPLAGDSIYSAVVTVPVRRFDDVAGELGVDPATIRLVKVDVEGNELRTVTGMRGFLASGPRPLLWCEVRGDSERGQDSYRQVVELLRPLDYEPFQWRRGALVRFDVDRRQPVPRVFDLAFQPRELVTGG